MTVTPGTRVPERQRLLLMARPELADMYVVSPDVLAAAGLVNPPGPLPEVAPEVLHIECVDVGVDVGAIAQPPARPSPPAPVGPMA